MMDVGLLVLEVIYKTNFKAFRKVEVETLIVRLSQMSDKFHYKV